MSLERVSGGEKEELGYIFHVEGPKTEKSRGEGHSMYTERKQNTGAGTSSGYSLVRLRNLEAESIRSRAENTRRCVKLKTGTEMRWSSTGCDS